MLRTAVTPAVAQQEVAKLIHKNISGYEDSEDAVRTNAGG